MGNIITQKLKSYKLVGAAEDKITTPLNVGKRNKNPKADETFHRRGRLRMKRPEKIERMAVQKVQEGVGIMTVPQKSDSRINFMDVDTTPVLATHTKGLELSIEIPENVSKPNVMESNTNDPLEDKKSPTRSEPANMSLRTAPRKSTRLISEIGEEKNIKHDNIEGKTSPHKIDREETSPGSKSPLGKLHRSLSGELLTKPDVPEDIETDDLMKQKGVTVSREGKLMIPSQKLSLSDDLCKVVCGEKGKKQFICQICEKLFMRKDKINYHIYSEHHEEFVRLGKGIPQILPKVDITSIDDHAADELINEDNMHPTIVDSNISKKSPRNQTKKEASKPSPNRTRSPARQKTADLIGSIDEVAKKHDDIDQGPRIEVTIKNRSPRKKQDLHQDEHTLSLEPSKQTSINLVVNDVGETTAPKVGISKKANKKLSPTIAQSKSRQQKGNLEHSTILHHETKTTVPTETETPTRPRRQSRKGGGLTPEMISQAPLKEGAQNEMVLKKNSTLKDQVNDEHSIKAQSGGADITLDTVSDIAKTKSPSIDNVDSGLPHKEKIKNKKMESVEAAKEKKNLFHASDQAPNLKKERHRSKNQNDMQSKTFKDEQSVGSSEKLQKPKKTRSSAEEEIASVSINEDPELGEEGNESDEEVDKTMIEEAAESLSPKHGKVMRKVHRFYEDIERLIEIQGEQRRLRNRRLYDSNDAIDIMERYNVAKKKKRKKRFIIKRLQEGANPFKFQLMKKKMDSRKIVFDKSKPFLFKIVKPQPAPVESNTTKSPVPEITSLKCDGALNHGITENDKEQVEKIAPADFFKTDEVPATLQSALKSDAKKPRARMQKTSPTVKESSDVKSPS